MLRLLKRTEMTNQERKWRWVRSVNMIINNSVVFNEESRNMQPEVGATQYMTLYQWISMELCAVHYYRWGYNVWWCNTESCVQRVCYSGRRTKEMFWTSMGSVRRLTVCWREKTNCYNQLLNFRVLGVLGMFQCSDLYGRYTNMGVNTYLRIG
jgi:hypothetical protein